MINTRKTLFKWLLVYGAIITVVAFTNMELTFFEGISADNWIW